MQLKPHAQDALLFKGSVTWEGDTLALSQCKGKLDATPLRAELRLHFRDVLAMEGSLSLGKLQLDEYLPLPESGKDAGTAKGKEGKAVAAADKESATNWPTINMRLTMSSLGWKKKMHLRDISLALSGSKGDYRLTSFQGVCWKAAAACPPAAVPTSGTANMRWIWMRPKWPWAPCRNPWKSPAPWKVWRPSRPPAPRAAQAPTP